MKLFSAMFSSWRLTTFNTKKVAMQQAPDIGMNFVIQILGKTGFTFRNQQTMQIDKRVLVVIEIHSVPEQLA